MEFYDQQNTSEDKITDKVLRQNVKVKDTAFRISMLKCQWAGQICRRIDNRWGRQVLEWRLRL